MSLPLSSLTSPVHVLVKKDERHRRQRHRTSVQGSCELGRYERDVPGSHRASSEARPPRLWLPLSQWACAAAATHLTGSSALQRAHSHRLTEPGLGYQRQAAVDIHVQVFGLHFSWEYTRGLECSVTGWRTVSFGRIQAHGHSSPGGQMSHVALHVAVPQPGCELLSPCGFSSRFLEQW